MKAQVTTVEQMMGDILMEIRKNKMRKKFTREYLCTFGHKLKISKTTSQARGFAICDKCGEIITSA
jgi:hypothetical protein